MAGETSTVDTEAFEALDRQRLLRVLRRALREEGAGRGCGGELGRTRVFRNLVTMIQEMPGGSKRQA